MSTNTNDNSSSSSLPLVSMREVNKHNTQDDCWVVLKGIVYNLTEFLSQHPGGSRVILQYAGKDGTKGFEPFHPPGIIETLPKELTIGKIDPSTITEADKLETNPEPNPTPQGSDDDIPPLHQMINVFDFEPIAQKKMPRQGWIYYSTGAEDEITLSENRDVFKRIFLRPRVLVDVSKVDITCKILGHPSSLPVYITSTALGKLAHQEGEVCLTKAAKKSDVIQIIPTLGSCSLEEIFEAKRALNENENENENKNKGYDPATRSPIQFFQLYVNSDLKITRKLVEKAEKGGCTAIFVTVDAPIFGRREKDMRNVFTLEGTSLQKQADAKGEINRKKGVAAAIGQWISSALDWDLLREIQTWTKLPVVPKGIQSGADAVRAYKEGYKAIVLSNHGGRQLDTARSGIDVLYEVVYDLKKANGFGKIEIYVDGGVRRGSDIFKALAIGANAVGVGRPFLYGMAAYGSEGVERVIQIFKEELVRCMMLMGTKDLSEISEDMVVKRLGDYFVDSKFMEKFVSGIYDSKL